MDKSLDMVIKMVIAEELEKGTSLSDIQTLVNEKFGQRMTYMDIRILASTLDVDWRALDPNAAKNTVEEPAEAEDTCAEAADEVQEEIPAVEENASAGNTVVEVSPIARPGMAFSGSVKFASGSTADWYVDTYGRLGLENREGEKPSQSDIEQFQVELNNAVRKIMGQ